MKTLADILPMQPHYWLLRLKNPGQHGPYAFHGGSTENTGLLVFPLLEKAEQFCLTVAKGTSKPEKVSADKFWEIAAKAQAISLADGPNITVCRMQMES